MSVRTLPPSDALHGAFVFLSASVPLPGPESQDDDHLAIEDAVISFTRAILANGGRIVFGGHPSVSAVMVTVAGEYASARHDGEPPIVIYQSELFGGHVPQTTLRMGELGYARIVWTEVQGGEVLDTKVPRPVDSPSLTHMRKRLIEETKPAAMVSAGGMEGIQQEYDRFKELRAGEPVFLLQTSGGFTAKLAQEHPEEAVDLQVQGKLGGEELRRAALYPLVMQEIVARLAGGT